MAISVDRARDLLRAVEQGVGAPDPLILRIMRMVSDVIQNEGTFGLLSTGEQLAVAFILDRHDLLGSYTMLQAIDRIGPDWLKAAMTAERLLRLKKLNYGRAPRISARALRWRREPKGPGFAEHAFVTIPDGRCVELLAWHDMSAPHEQRCGFEICGGKRYMEQLAVAYTDSFDAAKADAETTAKRPPATWPQNPTRMHDISVKIAAGLLTLTDQQRLAVIDVINDAIGAPPSVGTKSASVENRLHEATGCSLTGEEIERLAGSLETARHKPACAWSAPDGEWLVHRVDTRGWRYRRRGPKSYSRPVHCRKMLKSLHWLGQCHNCQQRGKTC